jgi:hypothetical protein
MDAHTSAPHPSTYINSSSTHMTNNYIQPPSDSINAGAHQPNSSSSNPDSVPMDLLEAFESRTRELLSQHSGPMANAGVPSEASDILSHLLDANPCDSEQNVVSSGPSQPSVTQLPSLVSGGWLLDGMDSTNCLPGWQ